MISADSGCVSWVKKLYFIALVYGYFFNRHETVQQLSCGCIHRRRADHVDTCHSNRYRSAAVSRLETFASVGWPGLDPEDGVPWRCKGIAAAHAGSALVPPGTSAASLQPATKVRRSVFRQPSAVLGTIPHVRRSSVVYDAEVPGTPAHGFQPHVQAHGAPGPRHRRLLQHGVWVPGVQQVPEALHIMEWRHSVPAGHRASPSLSGHFDLPVSLFAAIACN